MNKKSVLISFLSCLFLILSAGFAYAAVTINQPASGAILTATVTGNGGSGDGENITVSVTFTPGITGENATNVTYYYRTSSANNWVLIGTNATENVTSYPFVWNISNLADGITYEFNATVHNGTETLDGAVTTGIIIDQNGPGLTMEVVDPVANEEKSTFFFGDKVEIRCTRKDDTSGFNETNMTVVFPGSAITSVDFFESTTEASTAPETLTIEFTDTNRLGEYFVRCDSRDKAGEYSNVTNATFEIVARPPQGSSRPAGFVNPVGKKIISGEADLGRLTSTPTSVQMRVTSVVKLDIGGRSYSFSVKDLSESSLTLESGGVEIAISQGESSEADLDGDGTNDVKVTYHKQFKKGTKATADVSFEAVTTPVQTPPKTQPPKADTEKQAAAKASTAGSLLVTVIVIIVIIVVGYFLIKGKKK